MSICSKQKIGETCGYISRPIIISFEYQDSTTFTFSITKRATKIFTFRHLNEHSSNYDPIKVLNTWPITKVNELICCWCRNFQMCFFFSRSEGDQRDQVVAWPRPGLHRQLQPRPDPLVAVLRQLGRIHATIPRWGNDSRLCSFTAH